MAVREVMGTVPDTAGEVGKPKRNPKVSGKKKKTSGKIWRE